MTDPIAERRAQTLEEFRVMLVQITGKLDTITAQMDGRFSRTEDAIAALLREFAELRERMRSAAADYDRRIRTLEIQDCSARLADHEKMASRRDMAITNLIERTSKLERETICRPEFTELQRAVDDRVTRRTAQWVAATAIPALLAVVTVLAFFVDHWPKVK